MGCVWSLGKGTSHVSTFPLFNKLSLTLLNVWVQCKITIYTRPLNCIPSVGNKSNTVHKIEPTVWVPHTTQLIVNIQLLLFILCTNTVHSTTVLMFNVNSAKTKTKNCWRPHQQHSWKNAGSRDPWSLIFSGKIRKNTKS